MVAVRHRTFQAADAQTAKPQFAFQGHALPEWRVRDGRGTSFTKWNDALDDALATLGLTRDSVEELPPSMDSGVSVTAEARKLWSDAVAQYQDEGTALFDCVRPSLVIDGPYEVQDITRIARWKKGTIKDGRSLLRWALSFVEQTSVESQMRLVQELHAMKLSAAPTLWQFTQHLFDL